MKNKKQAEQVDEAVQVQFSRLFGDNSVEATAKTRTASQWRKTFKKVVDELAHYLHANVATDGLHFFLLNVCLIRAKESLKETPFFPSYVEAITRFALLLMGDYPDHRRRSAGKKPANHYKLNRYRTLTYSQTEVQRFWCLVAGSRLGFPSAFEDPFHDLHEFRTRYGRTPGYREFLDWYKKKRPEIYSALF